MLSSLANEGFAPRVVAHKTKNGVPALALIASTVGGVVATIVNFAAPDSGVFDFIMNSAGLVALFVYVFIALTQMSMRRKMSKEEIEGLELKMRATPWLNILLIAGIAFVFIVMLFSEPGRTQVITSLIATVVLIVLWPLARKNVQKAQAKRAIRENTPTS